MIDVFSLKLHHLTNLTHPALLSKCSSDNESPFFKQLVLSTHKGSTKKCICQWGRDLFLRVLCDWILGTGIVFTERILQTNSIQPSHFWFPGHFKKKKDLISNNEVLSDPNKQQNRTQEWTKTCSCHKQFFKERWGERWTNPDRLDADKLHRSRPSFLTRQEGGEQH